jgi:hypothetical protein
MERPEDAIQSEIGPTERPLWIGQPSHGLMLRATDAFVIPFSLLWGGFVFFWEYTVLSRGGSAFFALWGIPFVLIGLYIIFGRFFVDAVQRKNTAYAVTPERVVIVSGILAKRTKSLNIDTLSDVSLSERSDGSGTITFGPAPPWYWMHPDGAWPGSSQQLIPTFEQIPDARSVYETIRSAQRDAKKAP